MRCIDIFNDFVSQDSKEPLVIAMPMIVFVRDLLLRARRDSAVRQ